jgi:PAS domain S-box-containing protein
LAPRGGWRHDWTRTGCIFGFANGKLHRIEARVTAEAFREFRRQADRLPLFIWLQAPGGRIDWANKTWHEFVALPPDVGASLEGWAHLVHPDDLERAREAMAGGIRDSSTYESEYRVRPRDARDGYRWILARTTPHFDAAGRITYWLGLGTDIHASRTRADNRAAVLADLAEQETRAFCLITDSIPQLVWTSRPDGTIDWFNRRWYDYTGQTQQSTAGGSWQHAHHPDDIARISTEWAGAIASGESFETEMRLRAADGSFRMFLNRATPLRDRTGAIVSWFGINTDIDVEYNGRTRERRIAQTFQQAALQGQLPEVVGLSFDAIYEPGKSDALVGGDWFDAFRLVDGRIVFSVGDVGGSGLAAAVTMGSLRQSIRTAALINPDPVAVLDAVDRIVRDMSPDLLATAFVAVFDSVHGELRYASAGHPPPLLRRPDGTIETLEAFALPLGLRQRTFATAAATVNVTPGTLLVMYTDGLTEFGRDPIAGEASVASAVDAFADHPNPARALYRAVVDAHGPPDDIAILTVRFEDAARHDGHCGVWNWTFDATDAGAASRTRHEIGSILRDGGMSGEDVTSAELVFAELIGNVLRHASRTVRVALDRNGEHAVLHVLDEGTGFEHNPRLPSDLLAERGRGLYIVSHLTEELSITRRTAGGSHMRAVLAGAPAHSRYRDR